MVLSSVITSSPVVKTCVLAASVLLLAKLAVMIVNYIKRFKYYNSLAGEKNFSWIHGNIHMFPHDGEKRIKYLSALRDINGRYIRVWAGPLRPSVTFCHPETIKIILKSSAPKSRGFGAVYEFVKPWIGEGLIVSNGHTWARSRRLLTPAFHFDILKAYVKVFNECTDKLFKKLDAFAESGEKFDIVPIMTATSMASLLKCAMSYSETEDRKGEFHKYTQAVREINIMSGERYRNVLMWFDTLFWRSEAGRKYKRHCDFVHKIAEDVIKERKETMARDGIPKSKRLDFLDLLLSARDEDGSPMTDLEIRNEVDTFMFAGHDTTATAIPWNLHTLSTHPEYQEKVQAEMDDILDSSDDHFDWNGISKLVELPLCMKETHRLFSPVPVVQRQLTEDVTLWDGAVLEKGMVVNIHFLLSHRNPAVWEDPDKFVPERFKPENIKHKDSFAFTPFSGGSRNCIGQNFALSEEKVILGRILKRYKLEAAKDGPPVERAPSAVLRAQNGIWLRVKRREV